MHQLSNETPQKIAQDFMQDRLRETLKDNGLTVTEAEIKTHVDAYKTALEGRMGAGKTTQEVRLMLKEEVEALAFKVYAVSIDDMHMQTDYGVKLESKPTLAVNIASTIIIPIVLLIGIIIYCIKSTSSVLKKAIVSIDVILAYILIRVLMKKVF